MAILVKSRLSSDLQILVKFARYFFGFFDYGKFARTRKYEPWSIDLVGCIKKRKERTRALSFFTLANTKKGI